jgi:hypothetical protein
MIVSLYNQTNSVLTRNNLVEQNCVFPSEFLLLVELNASEEIG